MTALEKRKISDKESNELDHATANLRVDDKSSNRDEHDFGDTPPSYQSLFAEDDQLPVPSSLQTKSAPITSTPTELPCVIPQNSKAFQGTFFSPFIRAYPPSLAANGISQDDFLAFIDGLNEVFVSHPVFQGANLAGNIMGMANGVHPVQFAGMGLQVASGVAGAATSYLRTKAYFKTCNEDLFHPTGLHATVATTKKMMATVGHPDPEGRLRLHPLDSRNASSSSGSASDLADGDMSTEATMENASRVNDFKARRMQALEGYVAPLNLEVPASAAPDNIMRKMGAWQASRFEKKQLAKYEKQRAKLEEEREKVDRKLARREGKQEGGGDRFDRKTSKLEREYLEDLAKEDAKQADEEQKLERRLGKASVKDQEKVRREVEKESAKVAKEANREREKLTKEYEREMRKAQRKSERKSGKRDGHGDKDSRDLQKEEDKLHRKEESHANKIRWVVITPWDPNEDDEEVDSESDSMRSGPNGSR